MSPEVAKVLRRTAQLQVHHFNGGRPIFTSQVRPLYRALKRQWYALPSKARAGFRRQLELQLAKAGMPAPRGARLQVALEAAYARQQAARAEAFAKFRETQPERDQRTREAIAAALTPENEKP